MKKYILPILLIAVMLIAAPRPARAAFELGDKTLSHGGFGVDIFTQSSTGLTTIQDVFEPHQITGIFTWSLYVANTGSNALTDLNILIHREDGTWTKAPLNLVDAQTVNGSWNASCTTTLASGSVCVVGVTVSAALGWLKVTASAGTATDLTVVLFTRVQ